jgi:HSP20 family protein
MATELTEGRHFPDLTEMRHRVDQMLRDMGVGDGVGSDWSPSVDVVRRESEVVLRADVPGIKPDEIEIKVGDGILTVSGKHEEDTTTEEEAYIRRERRFGSFSRSMTLPRGVDTGDIEATTEDGVLEVRIPLPAEEREQAVEIKPTPKSG